jgi:hypothetical protein
MKRAQYSISHILSALRFSACSSATTFEFSDYILQLRIEFANFEHRCSALFAFNGIQQALRERSDLFLANIPEVESLFREQLNRIVSPEKPI